QQLEFDSSNLASWRTKTVRVIFVMTNILKYWDTKQLSKDSQIELAIDKYASQMIYTTIHPNLCDMIDECDYAHNAMEMLESHFHQGGWTAQVATFCQLCSHTFDLTMTTLLEHIQVVHKDIKKLESDGFKWTKDMIIGMFYQHGAPIAGPFSMEAVNAALDVKYQANPGAIKLADVCAEMQ
ncbi:hypothetical protein CROQUDRAFT_25592, partial [Cronartium quercuum f. sp. fusiforme G11]